MTPADQARETIDKFCCGCMKFMPQSDFYPNVRGRCKECTKKRVRDHRKLNPKARKPRNMVADNAALKTLDLRMRFDSRISPEPNTGCWIWMSGYTSNGYGKFHVSSREHKAHRVSWSINCNGGEFPSREVKICHSCDNRWCVNPEHLWPGSQLENVRDAMRKGRMHQAGRMGDKHGCAKLCDAQAMAIKNSDGGLTKTAREFGVSISTVWLIRTGRGWRHL
jgi:hypothetical protein